MFLLENAGEAVTSTTVSAVADVFPKSGIENLAADASFGEKLAYALKYAAIGLMTVFMVLIIIMAVLYLFKLFSVIGSKKKATATTAPAPKAAEAPAGDSCNCRNCCLPRRVGLRIQSYFNQQDSVKRGKL